MANEASIEGTCLQQVIGESSQSTVEINIKTLDSQIYTFRVDKDMPVPVLKGKLADATGFPVERQRLIFRGRVLRDDHLLSQYNLEDGHTLHLVVRQPVQEQPTSAAGNDGTGDATRSRMEQMIHSVVLGTVNIAEQEGNVVDISRIVGAVLNSLGVGGIAPEGAASSMPSTAGSNQVPSGVERGAQTATSRAVPGSPLSFTTFNQAFQYLHQNPQVAATAAPSQNMVVPDSLATLSEFISHIELALQNGGSQNPQHANSSEPPRSQTPSTNGRGLPTPEMLGSVMEQVQQLLGDNVTAALRHFSTGLLRESTLTDPLERDQIQAEAMRVGGAMQHLGAMLLELSRTIMTLRMGRSPGESSLNAGPAVYISPTGPNPIMVQPFTFQTSSPFGFPSPPLGRGASASLPNVDAARNINIHIHAGSSVSPGVSLAAARMSSADAVRGERLIAEQVSSGGNASAVSASTRGFPSTVVAAIPARATSGTSGHVLSIAYPIHVSTQLSMPIHSASAQGSHPPLSSGGQPNMTVPVPHPSLETTTIPSLVEHINSQIASVLSRNAQGLNSTHHSASAQGSHPPLSSGGQPNTTVPVPHPSLETTAIPSLVEHMNSQIASVLSRNAQGLNSTYNGRSTDTQGPCLMTTNSEVQNDMASVSSQTPFSINSQIVSGNAQDQSSSSNLQLCDTSCTREGSQLVSPGLSSQLGDANVYSQTQNEVGADDIGGSSSLKPLASDASMHGIKGRQFEQESFCSAIVDSRRSSDMRDGSITTSTEPNAICEPSVEIIHASPSSHDSERDRPAPLGLGLGGLQHKKRLKHPKSVGKDQMPCEKPSTSQNQQSIARGQQLINSLVSQSSDADGVSANGSVSSRIKDSLPMGGGGGTGQVDASDMMSTILQSPVFNNILAGVSSQTGIGSSSDLRNMLDQVIRSPALKNTMNEIVQQVEGHSQDTGVGRGHSGLDFSRMIQQMMPAVSQALGRASTQPAAIPGFQPEGHLQVDTIGRDGVLHESQSKVDLLQAVERIEHCDAPVDIFRAVLEAASHLYGEGNESDLSMELTDNEELTNEFTSMLARDLNRRLKQDQED